MTASQRAGTAGLASRGPGPDRGAGRTRAARRAAGLFAALAIGLAACGSDSEPATTAASTTSAATVANSSTTVASSATSTTLASATTVPTSDPDTPTTDPVSETCPEYTDKPDLPLKICDKGAKVTEVQEGLVDAGYDIVVDGFFGNQTRNAILEFQAAEGLEVDGVVGPLTFGKLFPTAEADAEE